MDTVLISAYWGIGDVLLQTPAIELLRAILPDACLVHRTMEVPLTGRESMLYGNPVVDSVDTSLEAPDLMINLGGYEFVSMSALAEFHKNFKHTHIFCDMVINQLEIAGVSCRSSMPALDEYLDSSLYLDCNDAVELPAKGARRRIVLCRATKGCPQKTWPEEHWQSLSAALYSKGYEIVSVGVDGDFHFDRTDLDFVGQLTFRQTAFVMKTADVYIGHGDGLAVAAYTLRVPSVCVWGAFADPAHYFDPARNDFRIVGRAFECSHRFTTDYEGWLKNTCINDQRHACIQTVTVDDVVKEVENLCPIVDKGYTDIVN